MKPAVLRPQALREIEVEVADAGSPMQFEVPGQPGGGSVGMINIGDMLERLTNHVLPSTIHRVQNPPPERRHIPRYSMPFFLHLRSDFPIATLPQCVSAENPDRYPEPITADQFLQQRLREIGLKK